MADINLGQGKWYQYHEAIDGSICVREEPGDHWKVIAGKEGSKAHAFANQQNKFWKPWMKESIKRDNDYQHQYHDDENDTFSRRIKKP